MDNRKRLLMLREAIRIACTVKLRNGSGDVVTVEVKAVKIAFSPALRESGELNEGKASKKAITNVVLTLSQETLDASVTASVPDAEQEQCSNDGEALHRSRNAMSRMSTQDVIYEHLKQ